MTRSAHPFAPGAIEHHTAPQRRALLRWLQRAAALMAGAVAVGFVAGLATGARAEGITPSTVGVHLHSVHLGAQGRTWNNANTGVYARWPGGLTLGTLRNSLYRQGTYVAWTWEHPLAERVSVAITAGATTGYDRLVQDGFAGTAGPGQHTDYRCSAAGHCRTVLLKPALVPLLVPSASIRITPQLAARLSFVAKAGADADHALHLSAEWRF